MKYVPAIDSATARRRFELGTHSAVLLGDIVSAGPVKYLYILVVYDDATGLPCHFVASEVNSLHAFDPEVASHFLGEFPGDRHINHGDSDDWADEAKFTRKALSLVRARLGRRAPGRGRA